VYAHFSIVLTCAGQECHEFWRDGTAQWKERMQALAHFYSVVKVLLTFLLSPKVKDNLKYLVNL